MLALGGCVLFEDVAPRKPETTGLIATPASYYSTPKARYLGTKYKDNLDRIVERITRNAKTSPLQFSNNISSVGGIGFFTHSATKTGDERFLEVVLATPDTFEVKGVFSDKVRRVFARYGLELLGITSGDSDIYQDRELSGYGLNLAWRNVVAERAGNRVTLERAIIYFNKDRVRNFLRQELSASDLLRDAVIYSVEDDGPLNLVSLRAEQPQLDFRPVIREHNLAALPGEMQMETVPRVPAASAAQPAPIAHLENSPPLTVVALEPAPPQAPTPIAKAPAIAKPVIETKAPQAAAVPPLPVESGPNAAASKVARLVPPRVVEVKPLAPATEKSAGEQLASLKNKPAEVLPPKPEVARSAPKAPKALEGFVIQLAFNDKDKAQRWAETMEKRGYAVSLTEAGGEGSLRVRLGNFSVRDDAERQLRTFKQDGLNGIVISLPQGFRPEARTSIP